jgi:hypothetical protein
MKLRPSVQEHGVVEGGRINTVAVNKRLGESRIADVKRSREPVARIH